MMWSSIYDMLTCVDDCGPVLIGLQHLSNKSTDNIGT